MRVCDALIVGGGPAGSSAARELVSRGFDVVLRDSREFPRDKVCAGWITPAVVRALDLDLDDYGRGRTLQPIHSFRVGTLDGRSTRTRREERPASWGIRRCEFDDYLLRRSGAEWMLGQPVRGIRREGSSWIADGEIRARWLVGAGGHFCPVARSLGGARREVAVAAQEAEFRVGPGCPVEGETPELLFCPDLAGYGWIFRKGDWVNVGLGRQGGGSLPQQVAELRRLLIDRGRLPDETPRRFAGHAYLLYPESRRPLARDGVLLAGDAAGLAHGRSGEGIGPAVESGQLAARAIATGGDVERGYEEALERRFGRRGGGGGMAGRLPAPIRRALATHLLPREWFARGVVLDRWFLQRR